MKDFIKETQGLLDSLGEAVPPGSEKRLMKTLRTLAEPHVDSCHSDAMGSLILHKKGRGSKLLLTAPMDSAGFLVSELCEDGRLRLSALGKPVVANLLHTQLRFAHGLQGEFYGKTAELADCYLDVGATSREEALRLVQLGDACLSETPVRQLGERLFGASLAARLCCLVLLSVLEELQDTGYDCYIAYTVQSVLGNRGARAVANEIAPDVAISLGPSDVAETGVKPGAGVGIRLMDNGFIAHSELTETLREEALRTGIAHQPELGSETQSEAAALHRSRSGAHTAALTLPLCYPGTPGEMMHMADLGAARDLLLQFLQRK